MKAASLNEIKKQLSALDTATLEQICVRLARYKTENKEMLTYLLFEAHDEHAYVEGIKLQIDEMFETMPRGNVYFIKKSLRKIVRFVNRQIRYSGVSGTELEARIYFCLKVKGADIPLARGTVLYNLYQQQVKKITQIHSKLPEDLQFDYEREIKQLEISDASPGGARRPRS
jgi:hypothetical protein